MKTIYMGKDSGPHIWWHWQNLSPERHKIAWHGRAWLHWPGNSVGIEWYLGSARMGVFVQCCDPVIGDEALTLHLALPFLFSVYLMVQNMSLLKRLPGVRWNRDRHGTGERVLSIGIHDAALWWRLWRNPMEGKSRDWRDSNFNPARFFLGHPDYSEGPRQHFDTYLKMPEGDYSVSVELYTATWKRPRWPWGHSISRADIEIREGVMIPGGGENSWDMEDDAVYGMTCASGTVEEAIETLRQSVMRDRER